MNKIIEINEDIISIGTREGNIIHVRRVDLNFDPRVGDVVDVYQNESKTTVILSHNSHKNLAHNDNNGNGINININNDNSNKNTPEYYAKHGTVVNKIIYCVLAFFLGWLGIHKFYAGKIGIGVLYIIFSWTLIPMFISFIECIIAAFKKEDANGNIII